MSISPNLGDLAGRDTRAFASSSATTERWGGLLVGRPDLGHVYLDPRPDQLPDPHPGDVLWMGTEGADGDMFPGDTIEVEISGIGTLRNYVVREG